MRGKEIAGIIAEGKIVQSETTVALLQVRAIEWPPGGGVQGVPESVWGWG